MDEMLTGHSESLARAKAWIGQHMADKNEMCYPEATNNRGAHGRERHDEGDMVGSGGMPSQGGAHQNSAGGHGSMNMPSQGGAHMGNMEGPRSYEREAHAYGDYVQGPQSGAIQQPQQQMPAQQYRRGGHVEREEHDIGSMVGGLYNQAKTAGTNYAKQQGTKALNQGAAYVKAKAPGLIRQGAAHLQKALPGAVDKGRAMAGNATGLRRGGHVEREEHSFGSFVKGVGKGVSAAGKAAAPYAKQALGQAARGAAQSAMSGQEAKRGGSIHDDHESRKMERRERMRHDD